MIYLIINPEYFYYHIPKIYPKFNYLSDKLSQIQRFIIILTHHVKEYFSSFDEFTN